MTQPKKILRLPALCEKFRMSRTTVYRLMETDSDFPKKITLSTRIIGFTKRMLIVGWKNERIIIERKKPETFNSSQ
ncbi:helix-turn-helix transcriptional regulator [Methyloglobulus sp.]|uniref:helix-turn-helix transcriptional regulator n=1 Tax=Methyloglobulus sp. TaxID=2518622 RepID=UPI00398A1D98